VPAAGRQVTAHWPRIAYLVAGRLRRHRGKSKLRDFALRALNHPVWKKDGDTRFSLTRYLVRKTDHPVPTITAWTTALVTATAATAATTGKTTMASRTATTAAAATPPRACAATKRTPAATAARTTSVSTVTRTGGRREGVVLHVAIADLDTLAATGINAVLPDQGALSVNQAHQRLGGGHQVIVHPGLGQLRD
jgi:hypothetical protein